MRMGCMTSAVGVVALTQFTLSAAIEQPTSPTLCTQQNKGGCDCAQFASGHIGNGGQTYTWYIDGTQRCLTTYTGVSGNQTLPSSSTIKPMPTLMFLNCYGRDQLRGLNPDSLDAADLYGMTTVYMSTPGGAWSWNTSIVNDTLPRDCSAASAGQDYTYFKDGLDFISTLPFYDKSRVYTYGFSQNGMGSAYVGRCFEGQVTGSWIGGGGLFAVGHGPVPPNKAGTAAVCGDTCKYWPVYPCHEAEKERTLQSCIQFYSNDPITVDRSDPTKGHGLYLYDRLVAEGNDGRMMEFSPTSSIKGGHRGPENPFEWFVSCFGGITPPCSSGCESALVECVGSDSNSEDYRTCKNNKLVTSGVCEAGCTPSYTMLKKSEAPMLNLTKGTTWGQPAAVMPRPSGSICVV